MVDVRHVQMQAPGWRQHVQGVQQANAIRPAADCDDDGHRGVGGLPKELMALLCGQHGCEQRVWWVARGIQGHQAIISLWTGAGV